MSVIKGPAAWEPGINVLGASAYSSSIRVHGSVYDPNYLMYSAKTIHPGAGYNAGTKTDGTTSGVSVTISPLGPGHANFSVNEDGVSKEIYKVSLLSGVGFIENLIQTGEINLKSDIIKGNLMSGTPAADYSDLSPTGATSFEERLESVFGLVAANSNVSGQYKLTTYSGWAGSILLNAVSQTADDFRARFSNFVPGTYNLAGGTNGVGATDTLKEAALIGDPSQEPKTGLYALDYDHLGITIAAIFGVSLENVQNALITLAENTKRFVVACSPPFGVGGVQNAVDWHNGLSVLRNSSIDSNMTAIYWPWQQVFDVHEEADVWYDPAIYGVRQMCYTDKVAEPWFAPAGMQRGGLSKPKDVEVNLNSGDIKTLYTGGNRINPIVNFTNGGITIWGQRTATTINSALDRLGVRRLSLVLKEAILTATRDFVFQPNDEFLWARIENICNPLLDDIANKRGISEYRVVCDSTTNTPVRKDRKELWCKILLKPINAAETLVFELNLTDQAADLGLI